MNMPLKRPAGRPVRGWKVCCFFSAVLAATMWAQTPLTIKDLPYRLDPMRVPAPNRDTVLLWRFETGDAADVTAGGNAGELRGGATVVDDGRFGKGVRLKGGPAGLMAASLKGPAMQAQGSDNPYYPLAFDFWVRLDAYPAGGPACLLEMAKQGGGSVVRLTLTPRGVLKLEGDGVSAAETGAPLPLGAWTHVAVQGRVLYQANYVYVQMSGVELLTNGHVAARAWAGHLGYQFPPNTFLPRISLGNSLTFDAGVSATFDEFRVTCSGNGFYPVVRQAFARPDAPAPGPRAAAYFQAPPVFEVEFDEPAVSASVKPPLQPARIQTAPALRPDPAAASGTPGGRDDPLLGSLLDELTADLAKPAADAPAVEPPLGLAPGVRGRALVVRGGEARLDLPKGLDLTEGTIELWLQPGDWDNLSAPPGRDAGFTYRNARPHIVTLWGVPRGGESGAPQRLVTLALSRIQGPSNPVAPEFENYFGGPKIPLAPHRWTHVLLMWGKGLVHKQPYCLLDGEMIPYDERVRSAKLAAPEVWAAHEPAYLTLGNGYETLFDGLRLAAYPLEGEEPHNARALLTGAPLRDLGNAVVRYEYRMSLGQLIATVAPLARDRARVRTAEARVSDPASGRTWDGRAEVASNGSLRVTFEPGVLPEGRYPVTGLLRDAAGEPVAEFASSFERRPVPWLNNRLGYPDTPPPPFTPVAQSGAVVRAVGREYRVGPDGNFEQVTVLGEPILAAPIRFTATVGGRTQALAGAEPARFGAVQPTGTAWRAAAAGLGVTVSAEVSFEYDGMAKYTLEVKPSAGPVTVDRLALEIPFKEEHGWLIHALPVDGNFRGYHWYGTGALRGREGSVWNSRTFSESRSVRKMTAGTFVPSVWLGGATRGLYWFADNDAGWVPDDETPAVETTWKDGVITLSLNFIAAPFRLEAPRRIVYALMATPAKPLPANYQAWDRGDYKAHPGVAGRLTSCEAFAPWEMPVKEHCMNYWPLDSDWEYAKLASDRQRKSAHGKYPPGVCLMLYHDKRFVPIAPEDAYFTWEWQRQGQGAWAGSKVDCLVWNMDQWFGRHIMDGIYIDDVFPIADYNWETGSAYKLPDGRVQPGSGNFAYREYLKRLYSVMASHGKPPVITLHTTHTFPPFISFATVSFDGEDGGGFKADGSSTFFDVWRLDRLLALDAAERTGLVSAFMLKQDYYLKGRSREHWEHMVYRVLRSKQAADWLFDWARPAAGWRAAYQRPGVDVFPFWRNDGLVRLTAGPARSPMAALADPPARPPPLLPDGEQPEIDPSVDRSADPAFATQPEPELEPAGAVDVDAAGLAALFDKGMWTRDTYTQMMAATPLRATVYRRPDGRCLVVVVNMSKEPLAATVALDLAALGVPADRRGSVAAADVDDGGAEPEGVDVQRLAKPDITAIDPLDRRDGFELPELGEALPALPLKVENGVFTVDVRPHDFRAIELTW